MPITLPNLDDRRYADLVEEARSLIPTYAPEWTDHNESDPGITLIELFAYLAEMLLYRLNRVTDANRYAFLKLLDPDLKPLPEIDLEEKVRETVLALRESSRAVTCADFEKLALEAPELPSQPSEDYVARAYCVARRNLEIQNEAERNEELPNHVSVVIVPRKKEGGEGEGGEDDRPQPSDALTEAVAAHLDRWRLVTTVVHVVGPRYVKVRVQLTVMLTPDTHKSDKEAVRERLEDKVRDFLHPLRGGPEGKGWPFGRDVYVSEIYEILDRQPSVDYVDRSAGDAGPIDELAVEPPDESRMKRNVGGPAASEALADAPVDAMRDDAKSRPRPYAVEIRDDELVDAIVVLKVEHPADDAAP